MERQEQLLVSLGQRSIKKISRISHEQTQAPALAELCNRRTRSTLTVHSLLSAVELLLEANHPGPLQLEQNMERDLRATELKMKNYMADHLVGVKLSTNRLMKKSAIYSRAIGQSTAQPTPTVWHKDNKQAL